jgi:hypothetical protein
LLLHLLGLLRGCFAQVLEVIKSEKGFGQEVEYFAFRNYDE